MLQRRRSFLGQLFRRLDTGGLDLDRDRALRQRPQTCRDLEHEVDPDVAGDGVADRALNLGSIPRRLLDDPPHHRAGRAAAHDRPDDDQQIGSQVFEPLRDGDGPVVELLDEHVRAEILGYQPLDGATA